MDLGQDPLPATETTKKELEVGKSEETVLSPIPHHNATPGDAETSSRDIQLPVVLVRVGKTPYIIHFVDSEGMFDTYTNDHSFCKTKAFVFMETINDKGFREYHSIPIRSFFKSETASKNLWLDYFILHEKKTIKHLILKDHKRFKNPPFVDSIIRDLIAVNCKGTPVNHLSHSHELITSIQRRIHPHFVFEFIHQTNNKVLTWYQKAMNHWMKHPTLTYFPLDGSAPLLRGSISSLLPPSLEEVEEDISREEREEEKETQDVKNQVNECQFPVQHSKEHPPPLPKTKTKTKTR